MAGLEIIAKNRSVTRVALLACLALFLTLLQGKSTDGKALYSEYCSPCHGDLGRGDGPLEYLLYPKPRDFTRGLYKLRSTPSGAFPTDEDLRKTVRNGMPGTAMPAFSFLTAQEIDRLVEQVKQLGDFPPAQPEPIVIPKPLPSSKALLVTGERIYSELGCHQCHGNTGTGDGPSAGQLKDSWGYPINVRDFTQGIYLGGGAVTDLYLRFIAGMDGTPMPSFLETIGELGATEHERQELVWGLIHYVKRLERKVTSKRTMLKPEAGRLEATRVNRRHKKDDFLNVDAGAWKSAPGYGIPVSRLWQNPAQSTTVELRVKSLYNSKYLAVMLEWDDPSRDAATYRIQDFQDAAAVQFSLTGKPGFHGMGSQTNPADIWFWKAEWQLRSDEHKTSDIALAYTNRASDAAVSTYPEIIAETAYEPGRDAGNPVSVSAITTTIEDVNAVGPQTLTSQVEADQNVTGRGRWNGKRWRVVFVRELKSTGEGDIKFRRGGAYPIAFAIWNGSNRDRNGQKMVSTWLTLELK